ncbi:4656_t:CDS:2 [Ambispora gerdemannii]|uniref:4656_t:CDS:1 n=1 Tax=Ambispora gerdemannii TaxID=144530 RepID=A0A9N8ZT00_9GLOM|nr:4656_t:CDS:2 [Ambispora gerdemannii]
MEEMLARKRAEIAAKIAAFPKLSQASTTTTTTLSQNTLPTPPSQNMNPSNLGVSIDPDLQRKIQEAKERVRVTLSKANPYLPSTSSLAKSSDEAAKAKGGLKVEAHPALLLDQSGKIVINKASALIPKPNFATVKANQRAAPAAVKQQEMSKVSSTPTEEAGAIVQNPYYDPRAGTGAIVPQRRTRKKLKFVSRGKYEALGNQMRAQVKLEKLKEEIAQNVKKAGMESELDLSDKAIKREAPPSHEWWDSPLLTNKTYDDVDAGFTKIDDDDSLVTMYVQHPVPIKPPGHNNLPAPKPLILTKKEQKKLRKQKRLELQKEKQDKIRLGLLPPDQPKSFNLMRVLTNDAIQDPTKVEAQVRKEMQKRQETHLKANEERKLTDEQRKEKKKQKIVNDLSHPKMKYKVDQNAQQLDLTGTVIINPNFSVIVVEGGPKAVKNYKKLMLRRINWSDTTRLGDNSSSNVDEAMDVDLREPSKENKCVLLWEGHTKERSFKGFWFKTCPTEKLARDYLRKYRSEHYWDLASKYVDEGLEMPVTL